MADIDSKISGATPAEASPSAENAQDDARKAKRKQAFLLFGARRGGGRLWDL
jgi:hypothetical protein